MDTRTGRRQITAFIFDLTPEQSILGYPCAVQIPLPDEEELAAPETEIGHLTTHGFTAAHAIRRIITALKFLGYDGDLFVNDGVRMRTYAHVSFRADEEPKVQVDANALKLRFGGNVPPSWEDIP